MSSLLSHLQEFGLSEKEANLYQILLDIGPAGAQEISKIAKINRSSVYALLGTLLKQGLVDQSQDNGVLKYRSVSPEKLIERADELAYDSARQEKEMNSLLPDLLSVSRKLRNQPRVLFYEGLGGIQTVSNDLLTQPSGILVYAFLPESNAITNSSSSLLDSLVLKQKNVTKIISLHEKSRKQEIPSKKSTFEIRYLPADKYPFSSELRIYADKVVFISTSEEFGVIIQSQDVADVMRSLFNLAWEEAGRLDTKIQKSK